MKLSLWKRRSTHGHANEQHRNREESMQKWRIHGPLSVLVDIINYSKMFQQYEKTDK